MKSALNVLMAPANAVCDYIKMEDEHERGMIRMLVNMLILTALGLVVGGVAFGVIINR